MMVKTLLGRQLICGLIAQVDSEPVLRAYAERVAKVFESPLPQAPEVSSSPEWAERAEAAAKGRSDLN